jgi:hypothetical protein
MESLIKFINYNKLSLRVDFLKKSYREADSYNVSIQSR